MFGFIGSYGDMKELSTYHEFGEKSNLLRKNVCENKFTFRQSSLKKFERDKVFVNTEKLLLCVEGVIYNLSENRETLEQSNEEALLLLYKKYGENIVSHLNGNFAMIIWDKEKDCVLLYANHTSYKPLYYWYDAKNLLFSTDLCWLYDTLYLNNKKIQLSKSGAYCLLSHGYMLDEVTLVNHVKKVMAGHYIVYNKGECRNVTYLDYSKIELDTRNYKIILEDANTHFNRAIKLVYDKDKEYGYKHICTLSGGLDSRSVLFASRELGYKEQLCITMAQSNTLDQKIAGKIADDLAVENVFYSLDKGNYLKNIDKAIEANGGTITYQGFAHTMKLLDVLDLKDYGSIHTGELGDCVFGGHDIAEYSEPSFIGDGAFSQKLLNRIPEDFSKYVLNKYKTKYEFFLFGRGLNSAVNGWLASNYHTESSSPFIDKDFLCFMLSVPEKYRAESKFYLHWMKKYHPTMYQYKWEATNALPGAGRFRKMLGRVERKIKRDFLKMPYHMNPYSQWYKENETLKSFFEIQYNEDIKNISNDELLQAANILYNESVKEKFQVLTLLRAVKRFHIDCSFGEEKYYEK